MDDFKSSTSLVSKLVVLTSVGTAILYFVMVGLENRISR